MSNEASKFNIEWDHSLFGAPVRPDEAAGSQARQDPLQHAAHEAPHTDDEMPRTVSDLRAQFGGGTPTTHDQAVAAFHRQHGTGPTGGGRVPDVFATWGGAGAMSGGHALHAALGGLTGLDPKLAQFLGLDSRGGAMRAIGQRDIAAPGIANAAYEDEARAPATADALQEKALSTGVTAPSTDETEGRRAASPRMKFKVEGLRGKRPTKEKFTALGAVVLVGWVGLHGFNSPNHKTLASTAISCEGNDVTVPFSEQSDIRIPFKLKGDDSAVYMHAKANYTSQAAINLCGITKKTDGKAEALPLLTYQDGGYVINRSAVTYTANLAPQTCNADLAQHPTKPQFCIEKPDGAYKVDASTGQVVELPGTAQPTASEALRLTDLFSPKGKNFKQYQTLIENKMYYSSMRSAADAALKLQVQKAFKEKLGAVNFTGTYVPNENDGSEKTYAEQHAASLSDKTVQAFVAKLMVNGVAQSLKGTT